MPNLPAADVKLVSEGSHTPGTVEPRTGERYIGVANAGAATKRRAEVSDTHTAATFKFVNRRLTISAPVFFKAIAQPTNADRRLCPDDRLEPWRWNPQVRRGRAFNLNPFAHLHSSLAPGHVTITSHCHREFGRKIWALVIMRTSLLLLAVTIAAIVLALKAVLKLPGIPITLRSCSSIVVAPGG